MAVNAGEVTEFTEVELKDLGAFPSEDLAVIGQCPGKGSFHGLLC